MLNCFNLRERHRITLTNICYFENAYSHPDRVMKEHDLVYMLEGGWGIGQDGISYQLLPDDVIILQAGGHHYNVSDTFPKTRTVYIHAEIADGDCFVNNASENSEACLYLATKISCRGYNKPKEIFNQIMSEFWSTRNQRNIKLSVLFDLLLCELSMIEHIQQNPEKNDCIYGSLYMIHTNPQKFYKVRELAEAFYVSEKYLENAFRKHTGKSVHEYQTAKKIDMIKTRIQMDPYMTFEEIAREYGFYDAFHLSKVFKKLTNISPKEYRAQLQEKELIK